MSNAELSFDDLIGFGAADTAPKRAAAARPKPVAVPTVAAPVEAPAQVATDGSSEAPLRRRRDLRAVENAPVGAPTEVNPPLAAVSEPVSIAPAVSAVPPVAAVPAASVEAPEETTFDDVLGLTGFDAEELQVVEVEIPLPDARAEDAGPATMSVAEPVERAEPVAAVAPAPVPAEPVAAVAPAPALAEPAAPVSAVASSTAAVADVDVMPTRDRSARDAKPARAERAPKVDKRGEFYRAELSTGWQRFRGNLGVRITGWVLLVGATGGLVAAAVSRF